MSSGELDKQMTCQNSSEIDDNIRLFRKSINELKLKDFNSEIRALWDVEEFVHQGACLLDSKADCLAQLLDQMLDYVSSDGEHLPGGDSDQARFKEEAIKRLCILSSSRDGEKENGENFIPANYEMSNIVQGGLMSPKSDVNTPSCQLQLDPSWLIAFANISGISRRHMILARLSSDSKLARDVKLRLFMVILGPDGAHKETKSAIEATRTFGSLLCCASIRADLLNVRSEQTLRAKLMIKTKGLSSQDESFLNRPKYAFHPGVHMAIQQQEHQMNNNKDRHFLSHISSNTKAFEKFQSRDECINMRASVLLTKLESQSLDREPGVKLSNNNNNNNDNHNYKDNNNEQHTGIIVKSNESKQRQMNGGRFENIDLTSIDNHVDWLRELSGSIEFGSGLCGDLKRRLAFYLSDFKDGFIGPPRTLQKTIATTWWLYFGILLPIIAFNSLNHTQTNGEMGDLRRSILGQAIGGLIFALFGGQPLVIIMTTAPLCLYTKVIYTMCQDYGFEFGTMYAAVGLWNCFFLIIYSLSGLSKLMKWCTRSTEEVFAMFIVVAFVTDAGKDMLKNFHRFYLSAACTDLGRMPSEDEVKQLGAQGPVMIVSMEPCRRDSSLLFLFLMLGLVWLAIKLYRFHRTPYFNGATRAFLSDYALPIAVLVMSYMGSSVFKQVYVEESPPTKDLEMEIADLRLSSVSGVLLSMALGFALSILFFMDQNISAAMVSAPENDLKKGTAYHYDLILVGFLNLMLTLFRLPMMHGVLPHSPLHVRSLADIQESQEDGHKVERITNVRETRVTGIMAHILMFFSIFLVPYPIGAIPRAVLSGLFLYMAITSLDGLAFFKRILLLFTEQRMYPPSFLIRRCPQASIHRFTFLQLLQLLGMCLFGFSPFNAIGMFFPLIIILLIPFRFLLIPKLIDRKHLRIIDPIHE